MYCSRHALRRCVLSVLLLSLLSLPALAGDSPKSVILLIGDGMGVGQVCATRVATHGPDGRLAMDTMPVTGFVLTHPHGNLVTDSAAAGTALATGVKTKNGTISMTPEGKSVRSVLELAEELGKSTGIISTKHICDATPAVYVSHVPNRGQKADIAAQMIASGVDIVFGGGKREFIPKSVEGGGREDGRNLLQEAEEKGYDVFDSAEAMAESKSDKMIGLFAGDNLRTERPEPTIAELTTKALGVLSKDADGFFIMSEGGQIDSYAHGNNAGGVIKQTVMFDDAVRAALDFAKENGETLVIVTADHETGGLAICDGDKDNPSVKCMWTTGGHSANMVPLYAYGPGSERFSGTHDNTEIPRLVAELWGQELN